MDYNVREEITYQFSNLIDAAVEVWELIDNPMQQLTGHVIM